VLEWCIVARCGAADDERYRYRLLEVEQHGVDDRGELIPAHAVHRVGVPRFHELAELALPVRERLAAVGLRGTRLRELVEGALGVHGVSAEEGDVDRSSGSEDERVH
jgi:hypothetical protein